VGERVERSARSKSKSAGDGRDDERRRRGGVRAEGLPDRLAATVTARMRQAYHAESVLLAQTQLEALAKELERTHPGAAGSLREGLAETLTLLRLGRRCRRRSAG